MCRRPAEKEIALLVTYYNEEREDFAKTPERASQLIRQGEYPHADVEDISSLASLMQVVQTIYNTDEAITR